jgi:hypothetical protein
MRSRVAACADVPGLTSTALERHVVSPDPLDDAVQVLHDLVRALVAIPPSTSLSMR